MRVSRAIDKFLLNIGVDLFNRSHPDRRVLQGIILPAISRCTQVRRVLFVGCDYYTRPYESIFAGKEYWTIEPVEKLRKYGARLHVIGGVEGLREFFPPQHFDAIICNGVIGWGLNTPHAANVAFNACFEGLGDDGMLVIGWAAAGGSRSPFDPMECPSLQRFEALQLPPLKGHRVVTETPYRHTFLFLRRPSIRGGAIGPPSGRIVAPQVS